VDALLIDMTWLVPGTDFVVFC